MSVTRPVVDVPVRPPILAQIREALKAITDHRRCHKTINLTDALIYADPLDAVFKALGVE